MLRQLAWIKWLLIAIVAVFVISNAGAGWYMWKARSATNSSRGDYAALQSEDGFQEQGKDLLLKGREQELLTLAASREASFPKDPYVFLYRGRAQYQLREYEKAIETFSIAETLAPDWRDHYIAPYVSEAKRQLSNMAASGGSSGQDEQPPPTANEIYELQLKKAVEQQQRMDQLLTIQEEHVKRFGAVLEKWERQAGLKSP